MKVQAIFFLVHFDVLGIETRTETAPWIKKIGTETWSYIGGRKNQNWFLENFTIPF
jgi:hypothetical protein